MQLKAVEKRFPPMSWMSNGLRFSGLRNALFGFEIRARKQSDHSLEIDLSLCIQPVASSATASVKCRNANTSNSSTCRRMLNRNCLPILFALSVEHTSKKVRRYSNRFRSSEVKVLLREERSEVIQGSDHAQPRSIRFAETNATSLLRSKPSDNSIQLLGVVSHRCKLGLCQLFFQKLSSLLSASLCNFLHTFCRRVCAFMQ